MEFKGTKNEWCLCKNWDDNFIEVGTKEAHNIALVNKEYEEAEANAQLIAAAPELLNMLQRLRKESSKVLSYFEAHDERVSDLDNLLCESIDIISKALGKEADDE